MTPVVSRTRCSAETDEAFQTVSASGAPQMRDRTDAEFARARFCAATLPLNLADVPCGGPACSARRTPA